MKIGSNFKDFYDNVLVYGQDQKIVYERKKDIIKLNNCIITDDIKFYKQYLTINRRDYINYTNLGCRNIPKNSINIVLFKVAFCGTIYPFIKIFINNKIKYFYDPIEYIKYLDSIDKDLFFNVYDNLIYKLLRKNIKKENINKVNLISKYFEKDDTKKDFFIKNKLPIIYSCIDNELFRYYNYQDYIDIHINDSLKDIEFFKLFDAYQCFQKLSIFIGGILSQNENKMVQIEDKYRIEQHGFDKWSFRRKPND